MSKCVVYSVLLKNSNNTMIHFQLKEDIEAWYPQIYLVCLCRALWYYHWRSLEQRSLDFTVIEILQAAFTLVIRNSKYKVSLLGLQIFIKIFCQLWIKSNVQHRHWDKLLLLKHSAKGSRGWERRGEGKSRRATGDSQCPAREKLKISCSAPLLRWNAILCHLLFFLKQKKTSWLRKVRQP